MSIQRGTVLKVTGIPAMICGVAFALSAIAPAVEAQSANTALNSSDKGVWVDQATHLVWTAKDNGSNIARDIAVSYCRDLRLGGQSDWRLPTIEELKTIYDASANVPVPVPGFATSIPVHIKGNLSLTTFEGEIWSSTPGLKSDSGIFYSFFNGNQKELWALADNDFRALCVRGSSTQSAAGQNAAPTATSTSHSSGSRAQPGKTPGSTPVVDAKPGPLSKIDDSASVVGLNLNMTIPQIRAAIRAKYPRVAGEKLTTTIEYHGKSQSFAVGEHFILTPKHMERDGDDWVQTYEYIQILYGPATNTPFAIIHDRSFRPQEFVTRDSVVKTLLEKHGPPIIDPNGFIKMSHLTWIARTNYRRSGISHFIYDKNPEDGSKACGIPELAQSPGGGHAFLYENKDDLSQNFEPLVGFGDNYSRDIVEDSGSPGKFIGCGLILEALLFEPVNDPSRVAEIVEKFVDFDKASAEFSALPSWLDKKDQETRSKQKKNELKPDL